MPLASPKKSNPTDREVDVAIYTTKKSIIAILNHSVKGQDPAKQHRFCPVGETSWCKWQQDQATGTSTYRDDDCLPEVFLELLRPTFTTLWFVSFPVIYSLPWFGLKLLEPLKIQKCAFFR